MQKDRDLETVIEAQGGSREAFGELVSGHQRLVTSIAFNRTGDLQRSEDIAQQSFLTAWQKIHELEEPRRFTAWLREITRNTASNSNRKASAPDGAARARGAEDPRGKEAAPDESSSLAEQQALLWDCLGSIPEDYREPLILFYRQDRSVAEVARQLDLSEDVVRKRLSRGRGMLKDGVVQFVEEILGATKPGTSFLNGVMAALPAAVGVATVKGGAALTTKKAAAKAAAGASTWTVWVGLFGLIFGMGAAEKNAGATVVKNQFYWFARVATITTAFLSTVVLAAVAMGVEVVDAYLWPGVLIYGIAVALATAYFAIRQSRLDRRHGRVKARFEVEDIQPATAVEFRKAVSGAGLSCWAWVLFAAFDGQDYATLGAALLMMLAVNTLRRRQSGRATSIPEQMRFQAANFAVHIALSASVFLVAGLLGRPTQISGAPNWQPCLVVVALGAVTVMTTLKAAAKFETSLRGQAHS